MHVWAQQRNLPLWWLAVFFFNYYEIGNAIHFHENVLTDEFSKHTVVEAMTSRASRRRLQTYWENYKQVYLQFALWMLEQMPSTQSHHVNLLLEVITFLTLTASIQRVPPLHWHSSSPWVSDAGCAGCSLLFEGCSSSSPSSNRFSGGVACSSSSNDSERSSAP